MTTPEQTNAAVPARRGRRALRITVLCIVVAVIVLLAATSWLSGR